jgi:endonuclease/exonuclease/phosphatase family metal-dependent hydrolase
MSWSSPALLSRWPIERAEAIPLPAHSDDGERTALACRVRTPGGAVTVVSLHLTYLPGQDDLRAAQLAAILDSPPLAERAAVRVLAGDFNANPAAFGDPAGHWRLTDTMSKRSETESGTERPFGENRTGRRIDGILLVTEHDEPISKMRHARIVLDGSVEGVQLSDHAGVMVEIAISPIGTMV